VHRSICCKSDSDELTTVLQYTEDEKTSYVLCVQRNNDARSCNHCCRRKGINITYSECVCVCVASVIQHAMRMRQIILSSVVCPAASHFATFSHKWHDFRENGKTLLNIQNVF